MPRTDLPAAQPLNAATPIPSLTLTAVDATNGNQFTYKGGTQLLVIRNGGGASINATVKSAATADGLTVADRVVPVAAGATAYVREAEIARQKADGKIYVDWSAGTSVTAGLINLL